MSAAVSPSKAARELRVPLDLLLHLPEVLDRVPVAVRHRALEPPHQRRGGLALLLLEQRVERLGRGELGEVEHPVDLPVAIVDVDRVLEQHGKLDEARGVRVVAVEVLEVALDLGPQAVLPPVEEVLGVVRQHPSEVGADLGRVLGVARHARHVARLILGRLRVDARVRGDRGRVDVAVDLLRDPVTRERRAEAPEHVVAGEPPAADVEEHRRDGVRAVEIVVDPEELLLALLPLDRELVAPQEAAENLLAGARHGHRSS